jgi:hypothetical protein
MTKLFSTAALAIALAVPAAANAQQAPAAAAPATPAPPAALTALRHIQDLGLSGAQVTRLEAVKASLQEAHRVHCGPMHASTPTPAQEEAHHREMKEIGDRHDAQASAVLTADQLARLARLAPARPAPAHHGAEHKEPAAGHSGHHPGR